MTREAVAGDRSEFLDLVPPFDLACAHFALGKNQGEIMMSSRKAWILSGIMVTAVASFGCAAKKNDVRLEMQRDVVVLEPGVTGIQSSPTGVLDTRDNGADVAVTMTGDPGLVATFDVPGRFDARPMTEASPGVYKGTFRVDKGQTGEVKVVGHLTHPPSGAHKAYDAGTLLTLKPSAPPSPVITVNPCADLDARLTASVFLFDFDNVELRKDELDRLDQLKGLLAGAPTCRVFVLGHTDLIGEADYNGKLSQRRADRVVQHLTAAGIPADRLEAHGYGKSHPVTRDRGLKGQAPNRRVEVRATNPYVP